MRTQRRRALTAGLLGGGAAGLLLFGPQLVNAAEPLADVITQAPPTTEPTDDAAATDDAATDDTTVATDRDRDEVAAEQGTEPARGASAGGPPAARRRWHAHPGAG